MPRTTERFRAKLDKEMKAGLMSLLVLHTIGRSKQPAYGYKIVKHIEERSQGKLVFLEGTIYPILRSLQDQGLIESYWGESPGGPQRKYYRLTKDGKAALESGLEYWEAFARAASMIIESMGE